MGASGSNPSCNLCCETGGGVNHRLEPHPSDITTGGATPGPKKESTWSETGNPLSAAQKMTQGQHIKPGQHVNHAVGETPPIVLGIGKHLIVAGGLGEEKGEGRRQLSSVERFDETTQRFTMHGAMNARRLGAAAAFVPGHGLFVCGGFDGKSHMSSVEMLSSDGVWHMQTAMPKPRTFAGAVT